MSKRILDALFPPPKPSAPAKPQHRSEDSARVRAAADITGLVPSGRLSDAGERYLQEVERQYHAELRAERQAQQKSGASHGRDDLRAEIAANLDAWTNRHTSYSNDDDASEAAWEAYFVRG